MPTTAEINALEQAITQAEEARAEAEAAYHEIYPVYNARHADYLRASGAVEQARLALHKALKGDPLHPSTVRGILIKAGLRTSSFSTRFSVEQGVSPERCSITFWKSADYPDDPATARAALAAAGLTVDPPHRSGILTVRRPKPAITPAAE